MTVDDKKKFIQQLLDRGFTIVAPNLECRYLLDGFYKPERVLEYLRKQKKVVRREK